MQQHLSEEQLVEIYYSGEPNEHLHECKMCGEDYQQLRAVLALVSESPVPERGEEYGDQVYARVLEAIEREDSVHEVERGWSFANLFSGWNIRNWSTAAAMAALLVLAFGAGRAWQSHVAKPEAQKGDQQAAAAPVRERVLLVALGEHLDRSQMVLMEVTHTQTIPGVMPRADISAQQRFAEDLISDNRLYRQTAMQVGETGVAGVLEELERVLIEIANSPSKLNARQLDELQKRIEKEGIVFKVRVIGSTVREKDSSPAPVQGQGKL
jgi:hypothetical protein